MWYFLLMLCKAMGLESGSPCKESWELCISLWSSKLVKENNMMVQCGLLPHALDNTKQSHDGLEVSLPKDFSFVQEHDDKFGTQDEPCGRWYQSRSNVCRKWNFHSPRQEVSQNSSGQTGNGTKNTWSDRKLGREHTARQETRKITQPDWKSEVHMCYRNSAITWSDRKSDRDVLTAQKVSQRSIGIEVNTQVLEDRACKAQEAVR